MRRAVVLCLLASFAVAAPAMAAKKVRRATKLSEAPTVTLVKQVVKGRSQRPMVVIEIPRVPPAFDVGSSGVTAGSRKLPKHRGH